MRVVLFNKISQTLIKLFLKRCGSRKGYYSEKVLYYSSGFYDYS